jgi:integrase
VAEITNINKGKGTAQKIVQDALVVFRQYMDIPYIENSSDEDMKALFEAFGGKPGQTRVKTPKKLTAEQAIAFLDFSGFPLADENAKFSIADAIRLEAPEMFEEKSFKDYQKKFGKTMEMQEKGASASKNITTAKTPKAANQPVADLDPKTATLREVAQAYAEKSKRKDFVGPTIQYFKEIADEPGSALRLFEKDAEGRTLLSKTFTSLDENAPIKAAMQNLRQVGILLKEKTGPDTPEYKLLPDEKPDTALNKRIFGRAEPPKSEAQIAISSDPKKQARLFEGVSQFLDNPETRPAALAILFNLNTGLRPNAVLNLTLDKYFPDTGAVYIEADVQGAKGRAVNIPLNPVADSILQELLQGKKPGDRFFTKSTGAQVKTDDINKILRTVKVPQIMYDQSTKKFYDSLHPENGPGKTGSPLLRNVHSSVALSLGIPQERTAYLQGRSLKAASKGSTGELAGYQKAFPGEVSDVDREFSSQVSSFYGKSAADAGFDIQSKIPMPETRITTQTAGYEGYFDLPVREEAPQTTKPILSEPASAAQQFPETVKNLEGKFNISAFVDAMKNKLGTVAAGSLTGLGVYSVVTEPEAAVRDIALETAGQALKLGKLASAPSMALTPSELASGELRPEDQPLDPAGPYAGQDFIPAPEVEQGTPRTDMARIAREDAGFIPEPSRVPEAAPVRDEGFLSR